jgi:hypothetical protein
MARLTFKELLSLFGPVREDDNGTAFVLVDNKELNPDIGMADDEEEGDDV